MQSDSVALHEPSSHFIGVSPVHMTRFPFKELVSVDSSASGQSAIDSRQLRSEEHLTGLATGHVTMVGQLE